MVIFSRPSIEAIVLDEKSRKAEIKFLESSRAFQEHKKKHSDARLHLVGKKISENERKKGKDNTEGNDVQEVHKRKEVFAGCNCGMMFKTDKKGEMQNYMTETGVEEQSASYADARNTEGYDNKSAGSGADYKTSESTGKEYR